MQWPLAKGSPWRFRVILILMNLVGLVWIHHDLTSTPKPRLRILAALPARDVDTTDRFSLVFDEPLQLRASLGTALIQSPFVVKPQPPGRWVWSEPTRLDFVLDKPLPPGRVFVVRPAADLESQTGRTLVGQSEFRFETHPLRCLDCRLQTADRRHANIELHFNQPVDPGDLLRNMRVTDAKTRARLEAECMMREPAERHVIRIKRPGSDRAKIELAALLTGSGGELGLGSTVTHEIRVEELFRLRRARVEKPGVEEDIAVELQFSRQLDTHKPLPQVNVTPTVDDLRVSYTHDGSELRLKGRFACGRRYTATVGLDVVSERGEGLGEFQTVSFTVPDRRPAIRFPNGSGVLSPKGNLVLDLTVANVGGLKVHASRVHANNLLAHLREADADVTARSEVDKTFALSLVYNEPTKFALDLRQLIGRPLGIYHVTAGATDRTWTRDSAIVAVTDLAITCKQERDGLVVWVTSLSRAEPVSEARVSAISYNNQVLGGGVTGPDGIARLEVAENHPDGKPWVVVAEKGEDMSYLQPENRLWVIDDVDQSGRDVPRTYDVMLYTERGVYRPGDTIHLTGLVRDAAGRTPPAFPLCLHVKRPDGRTIATLPVRHDPTCQGIFQVAYPTDERGQTGPYRFVASLPGAKETLGQTQTLVEAFVPARIEVSAEPSKARYGPKDKVEIKASVRYLFGKPAVGLTATAEGTYRREPFRSERFRGYSFTPPEGGERQEIEESKAVTDVNGQALLAVVPPGNQPPGWWRGSFALTVHEEGGRSVSKNVSVVADTAGRHIGLRIPEGRIAPTAKPFNVDWVQVTGDDHPAAPGAMHYSLVRVEFDTTLEKIDGRPVWKSTERLIPIAEGEIGKGSEAKAKGTLPVTCPKPGEYRLRVSDCTSGGSTSQVEFYACEGESDLQSVTMERPERLEIVLDKEKYIPGTKARVLVRSPIAGRLLLTAETDKVIDTRVVELKNNTAEVELVVTSAIRGGAFVTATVVRPVNPAEKKWLPHRAIGLARLLADHTDRSIPVAIEAAEKVEPGCGVTVTVRATKPTDPNRPGYVHLWAVDEGILMTTAFRTPDPLSHFFAPRCASVLSSDLFSDLMPDHLRPAGMARIGADGWEDDAEALRRGATPARRRESAVVWNDVFPLDSDGTACARIVMPELTGEMRLMAVVVDGDRYGTAHRPLTLTSPLLLETSWPRFAAPGDHFRVPIRLFNTTTSPLAVDLTLRIDGPIQIENPNELKQTTVGVGGPQTLWACARATDVGHVTAHIEARSTASDGSRLLARAKAELVARPASTLHAESKLMRLEAGKSITIEPSAEFLRQTTDTRIRVGRLPSIHLQPFIEELLDYPYGCVEQTTSQLYALLHAGDVLGEEPGGQTAVRDIKAMIAAGIARLWSMQTRSGGLSYWPGSPAPDAWATTYAAGFLAQAKRAGHAVDRQFVDDLLKYVQRLFLEPGLDHEKPDVNTRAQICRVLAAFDKPQLGWMSRLSEQADQLDMAGRAHLAMAWMIAGRKDRAKSVLLVDSISQKVATTTGGRLTSQVEQEAVLLDALLELDPKHEWVPSLVDRLEKARLQGKWSNTLEKAAAVAALSRYQATTKDNAVFEGTIRVGDRLVGAFDQERPQTVVVRDREGAGIRINSSGTGTIYLAETPRGLRPPTSTMQYDRQLRVRRRWTVAGGKSIENRPLHVGDLIRVEIEVAAPDRRGGTTVENVAIVDALPGGMEVENPRLATSAKTGQEEDLPDRVEFLDDRVLLFCSVGPERRLFTYALRAATPGTFVLPPVEASCMYDVSFASINGGGEVTIVP